jgi:hypothetical protein
MEVGQGPNWGCSAKGKKNIKQDESLVQATQHCIPQFLKICSGFHFERKEIGHYLSVTLENVKLSL